MDFSGYHGKKVLVTGHTGFKGTWLCHALLDCGATVVGVSLPPSTSPSLFQLTGLAEKLTHYHCDIRDFQSLHSIFNREQPQIVFHLAAQPLVGQSYKNPVETYETNVMGTVHIMECVRLTPSVVSMVNITTDKVYQNKEWHWGYREEDPLDGFDPYSNSKSCSELVTHSYQQSFFSKDGPCISTLRAGNVIGGGDFSPQRILPDCIRGAQKQEPILLRNPHSVRPYQHVLEPVYVYLMIGLTQTRNTAGAYNVGPEDKDCVTTQALVSLFCSHWGQGASWSVAPEDSTAPHEAHFLKLDCSKLKGTFSWTPTWDIEEAVVQTIGWTRLLQEKQDVSQGILDQWTQYQKDKKTQQQLWKGGL